ncbi:hypothetical protein P5673_018690 [Acropora cervicornis]|uniref:Uncharacterized protein n=1 Tax=Acropora cervicornis TaxID=6130 RepID=A0AAD9V2R8_ACRCE|nr:hypothetical protein P5673_018690 [Acropora cervicornis]
MVDRCAYVKMLVKSRADSTAKTYLVEIRRFFAWCKQNSVADSYPSYSTVLFTNQHKSYSVLVMVYVLESVKGTKGNRIVKKEPISTKLITKIMDKFATEGASLKDLRIAALCALGFAA